ncbi:MAG TPA: 4-(cytidine 5'-diphospho)-2-C-methyl-D-erythritol kinase [Sphingobacteriaceae bacterium]|nr:4-(cytidine 5'-diphospho)-2-C-methyl-D-erythritol kinase [Sphingobacteriaceae bacterium]
MIQFANAKINLGLQIINRRPDGYHNLETVFYPIPLYDVVEIIRADQIRFFPTGLSIPDSGANNLCMRAYYLLKQEFGLPPVEIHLHKTIPMGAGLGGGSSDAAATLRALNEEFRLGLSDEKLEEYAEKIGSDCPFFIRNKAVFATQTGTSFEEIELDLKGLQLLLVWPALHISTAQAYQSCIPRNTSGNLKTLIHSPLDQWQNSIENDFEKSLFDNYPVLPKIKAMMYDLGAAYASMSGSGSAMYGIFREKIPAGADQDFAELDPRIRIYHLAL